MLLSLVANKLRTPLGSMTPLVQQRGVKQSKMSRKPHIAFKFNPDGSIKEPKKIVGYDPDEVEKFKRWLRRTASKISLTVGATSGDRFVNSMQREIDGYIETDWGIKRSIQKAEARRKRTTRRKLKKSKKLWKRMDEWLKLEELKEDKILRDRKRKYAEDNNIRFSFDNFLREQREKRKKPYVILGEEEFHEQIKQWLEKNFFWGPKQCRRRNNKPVSYLTNLLRENFWPWEYEMRRRSHVTMMVQEREEAIAKERWRADIDEKRRETLEHRKEEYMKQLDHWNSVFGKWHKENNQLRQMKTTYVLTKEKVLSSSRKEFLKAIEEDVDRWATSPHECRFMRFRMITDFPYNKTVYS
eukprot:TRINITY_DN6511_c0_g2_i4.p1 TRINITY_DN6511_c0_g2~~TRINITY_DN6511_c0_g2_i4.p1  ORF type:complete len:356 (-),score=80.21 TRINITY_DN6511_c0_g2_i4:118-1185(-)